MGFDSSCCKLFYDFGQKVVGKFMKLSKLGFSMECFTAENGFFYNEKCQNLAFSFYFIKNAMKLQAILKNRKNISFIDLILTNSLHSFQNSCVIETGLSDFHKMMVFSYENYFSKIESYNCSL